MAKAKGQKVEEFNVENTEATQNAIKENNLKNMAGETAVVEPKELDSEVKVEEDQENKASFDYDDELQEVYLDLANGKELVLKAPRTRQVLSAKKMSRRAFPEDEGADLNEEEEGLNTTVALMSLCVKKYGDSEKMTVDDILDLEIRDFTLVSKAFECFRDSINIDG